MTDDRAQRFGELDEAVQELLSRMKPEHVETLEYLSTLPKDEVRGLMKMFRDIKAVSKFLRWAIATLVAIFIGASLSARTSPRLWGG